MRRRSRFASGVFYLVAAWAALCAIVANLGLSPSDLPSLSWNDEHLAVVASPDAARLVLIFARFVGGLMCAAGVSIALLVFGPLRRDERWAKPVIVVLCLGILLPQLLTWVSLGNPAPAIGVVCGLIVLVAISAYLVMSGAEGAAYGDSASP